MEDKKERIEQAGTYERNDDVSKELYNFAYQFMQRMNTPKDYGTGDLLRMVDAHILTLIADRPGITVIEAAKAWERTSGRISQVVSGLAKRGFVERRKEEGNAKSVHLYVTEKGQAISDAHKAFDQRHGSTGQHYLKEKYTPEDFDSFRKVLHSLTEYYETED